MFEKLVYVGVIKSMYLNKYLVNLDQYDIILNYIQNVTFSKYRPTCSGIS